jgi:hypothetical protein
MITASKVDFREDTQNAYLEVAADGGTGVIENPAFKEDRTQNKSYKDYVMGRIVCVK